MITELLQQPWLRRLTKRAYTAFNTARLYLATELFVADMTAYMRSHGHPGWKPNRAKTK